MTRPSTKPWFLALAVALASSVLEAGPLLTGVVEDGKAQTIEMPSLPGAWQRRVDWMAPEGSQLVAGDLAVRLDPGDLISREEQSRTDLEKRRLSAARRIDELKLEQLDAESALLRAGSAVRLAEFDAIIPASTLPRLEYERYQLTLETAKKTLVRAQADLLNKMAELRDAEQESRLEVQQAESNYQRIKAALEATEIRAEKAGFIIYEDNRFTGRKVFPGETLYSGFKIASIASRDDLQLRFWVHEADFLQVQVGQSVAVSADTQGTEPFMATIRWTSNQAAERQDWSAGGYFEVIAEAEDGIPQAVMPGMSVMGEMRDGVKR
jgi:multidrug resistance efflux pump